MGKETQSSFYVRQVILLIKALRELKQVLRFIVKPNLEPGGTRLQSSHDRKARKLLISREITHATNFMATRPEERSARGGPSPHTDKFKRNKTRAVPHRRLVSYPKHVPLQTLRTNSFINTTIRHLHKHVWPPREHCPGVRANETLTVVEYGCKLSRIPS